MLTWHTAGQDEQTVEVCFNWNHGSRESKRSRSTQLVVVHTFETAKHSEPNLRRLPKPLRLNNVRRLITSVIL